MDNKKTPSSMIVYYSGYGRWEARSDFGFKSEFRTIGADDGKNIAGFFVLKERRCILNLKFKKSSRITKLYPCYDYEGGEVFEGFSEKDNVCFIPYEIKHFNGRDQLRKGTVIDNDSVAELIFVNENSNEGELSCGTKSIHKLIDNVFYSIDKPVNTIKPKDVLETIRGERRSSSGKIIDIEIIEKIGTDNDIYWTTMEGNITSLSYKQLSDLVRKLKKPPK